MFLTCSQQVYSDSLNFCQKLVSWKSFSKRKCKFGSSSAHDFIFFPLPEWNWLSLQWRKAIKTNRVGSHKATVRSDVYIGRAVSLDWGPGTRAPFPPEQEASPQGQLLALKRPTHPWLNTPGVLCPFGCWFYSPIHSIAFPSSQKRRKVETMMTCIKVEGQQHACTQLMHTWALFNQSIYIFVLR